MKLNGLITNVGGTIDSIKIGSISNNTVEANFLRGGVINLQGASIKGDINIGEVNNNTLKADTSTGFVLYLRELQNNQNISSSFKTLNVNQISGNTVEATNITSLLLRTALVPVNNATVISKNGNVTVDNISDNNLTAINCNDNARGGIIYNFLHSNVNTINTTVSLGDINLKEVLNNRLETTVINSTRALNGRHASGAIIANSIQMCQGTAIIKSITGKYIGNSIVSKAMPASGGVIFNSLSGKGNAFAGIGFTLNDKNEIIPIKTTAISGTYKDNFVKTEEGDANGGVIANYIEASNNNDDVAKIGSVKADFSYVEYIQEIIQALKKDYLKTATEFAKILTEMLALNNMCASARGYRPPIAHPHEINIIPDPYDNKKEIFRNDPYMLEKEYREKLRKKYNIPEYSINSLKFL